MTHDASRYLTPSRLEAPHWNPARYINSLAVVIFPYEFLSYGTEGRHEALSSVLVFEDETSLYDDRKPTEAMNNVTITAGRIYYQLWRNDQIRQQKPDTLPLIGHVGQGELMTQYKSKKHPTGTRPWKIVDLDMDTYKAVVEVWEELMKK